MKFTTEIISYPAGILHSEPAVIAQSLARILNHELCPFWGSAVTVTHEEAMRFTVSIYKHPAALHECSPRDIANALARILNSDLNLMWGSQATVLPELVSA
jgi:hypothetical protein